LNRQAHWLFVHHARIADVIVKRAFLRLVEDRDDISDHTGERAQQFRKISSEGARVGNPPAIGRHYFYFAGHFSQSRAVSSDQENFVTDADGHLDGEQDELKRNGSLGLHTGGLRGIQSGDQPDGDVYRPDINPSKNPAANREEMRA
jgi:hypothetical protein